MHPEYLKEEMCAGMNIIDEKIGDDTEVIYTSITNHDLPKGYMRVSILLTGMNIVDKTENYISNEHVKLFFLE